MLKKLSALKLNRPTKFLLLTFCWTILPLLLLEFLMTILEPYIFRGNFQYDPDLGFRNRPYSGKTNQFGFNDRDYPLQKEPGTYRIVFVGDSFSWMGGKKHNYIPLLAKKFEGYYGKHQLDIINTGYIGTHTVEELAMLKKYGLQYNPDQVALGFFAGNDFLDGDPNRKRIIVNDLFIDIDKRQEFILFGYPIIPKSRVLTFIEQRTKIWTEEAKAKKDREKDEKEGKRNGFFARQTYLNMVRGKLEFCNIAGLNSGERNPRINYILNGVSEMKTLLDSKKIKLIVGIYPDEYQVDEQLLNEVLTTFKLNKSDYDLECQQRILKKHLEANAIPYVDMREKFRQETIKHPGDKLYLLRDTHWNDRGNQLAADIWFDTLRQEVDSSLKPEVLPAQNLNRGN